MMFNLKFNIFKQIHFQKLSWHLYTPIWLLFTSYKLAFISYSYLLKHDFYSLNQCFEPLQFFERLKEFNKIGLVRRLRKSGILQWKIFWKEEKLKFKKLKMKIFKLLNKIVTDCNLSLQKLQFFSIMKT